MNYERALAAVKQQAEGTPWYQDFTLLEFRLRENLDVESRLGSTEQVRADRVRVIGELNALCLAHMQRTFNDLLVGTGSRMPLFTVPYLRNPLFVGRAAELQQLERLLAEGKTAAVAGIGGVGKTQLAVELAYRILEGGRYPGGIMWVPMDQPAGIASHVAALSAPENLNLPGYDPKGFEQNLALVRREWERPEPRLLVFDNLEDPALLDEWRPRTGGSRVLITTRRPDWPAHLGVPIVSLRPVERQEAIELLLTPRAGEAGVSSLLDEAEIATAANAICEELGDLPLALALAAAYLETNPDLDLPRYLSRLRQSLLEHPSLDAELDVPLPTKHVHSVAATIALSYNQLDAARHVDSQVLVMLHRAAQMAAAPIPRRLFLRAGGVDPDIDDAEEEAGPAFARLRSLGLMERLEDGALRLHRLIAAFARARSATQAAEIQAVEQALIHELHAINEAGNPRAGVPYFEHARAASERAFARADRESHLLLFNLARLFRVQGDFREAIRFSERSLVISEQLHGPKHPETATNLNNLGLLLKARGAYAAARPLYERALAIREAVLGPNHPDTATSLNNLALLLKEQGGYAAARPLYERALAIREAVLGPNHPDMAISLNNLGLLLKEQGDYAAARPLHQRALAIREAVLGPNHPDTATSLNNLALLLKEQGGYAAARPLYERALAIRESALGPKHPATATSLNNLAQLLKERGDYAAARPLFERALAIREAVLGTEHPRSQVVKRNLATLPVTR